MRTWGALIKALHDGILCTIDSIEPGATPCSLNLLLHMGRTSKDKRDIYYRKAKELGYRARSAFKLEQIDQHFDLLANCHAIVDLCAAPGSWSQYMSRRLSSSPDGRILAVDLQRMEPLPRVTTLRADITASSTHDAILRHFPGGADIVLSDGAPDVTGAHDFDAYVQQHLVLAALHTARAVLRPGGAFVAKIFRVRDADALYAQLAVLFDDVVCAKPRCSRVTSHEAFVVCRGYTPVASFDPVIFASEYNSTVAPDCLDSTVSYSLSTSVTDKQGEHASSEYVSLPPVQPPTEPPYMEARKRLGHGSHLVSASASSND